MNQICGLIFDLGNVVFECSFAKIFSYFSARTNFSRTQLESFFKKETVFNDFERNQIGVSEFIAYIAQKVGYPISYNEFEPVWNSIYLDPIQGIEPLLVKLKKEYRLVALTNTNTIHAKVWPIKYKKLLDNFEHIFCSHEMQVRKPQPAAYRQVLNHLGLAADQVVFLDDSQENILAAHSLGIKTIWVKSFSQMKKELQDLGIIPQER